MVIRVYSWLCAQGSIEGSADRTGIGCLDCKTFLFLVLATCSDAQGLLLSLYSRITPGRTQETVWAAGDQTMVGCVRGKGPTH